MDGLESAAESGVLAPLSFLVPMAEKPVFYNYDPPPGVPVGTGRRKEELVQIHDGRAREGRLSLDHEGFILHRHRSAIANFYDENEIKTVYYPECERLIASLTDARRVVAFDHILRNATRAKNQPGGIKSPAKRMHNDYTAGSAPQRVRDFFGEEAQALLSHRFAIINLWRPIGGQVLESPLALCDAESLAEEDLVPTDLKYPDRTGEIYSVTFSRKQRWYYFHRMKADEVLLIRCFDSDKTGAARFSAHGAFGDPSSPADAPPRESIEVRTFAFFGPEAR
jgi:hypothetical protein